MVTPNLSHAAKFTLPGGCGGGTPFFKCLGRFFFGEESKIFGFAWGGELTLDDTWRTLSEHFLDTQCPLKSVMSVSQSVTKVLTPPCMGFLSFFALS